jgi:myxalamid-type polyketide synthase MxaB
MGPKVEGSWHLHRLTEEKGLDLFWLFSSAASLLGSKGQANHAAANAFLDALAAHRRGRGLPGLSINWGPWSEIGAAARNDDVAQQWKSSGIGWISPDQGLAALGELCARNVVQAGVVPIDWARFRSGPGAQPFLSRLRRPETPRQEPGALFLDQVRQAPPPKRKALLTAHLRTLVANVLALDGPDVVDVQEGFFRLGMDSLTSVELRNQIQHSLQCKLSPTFTFNYPCVRDLVEYLLVHVLEPKPAPAESAPSPGERSEASARLDDLESLSQDELAELLAKRLSATD